MAFLLAASAIPVLAWLAPRGFAPLFAVVGLLCLPSWKVSPGDRLVLAALGLGAVWAAVSELWAPYRPHFVANAALQLALMVPLAWASICGARALDPSARSRALNVLSWGLAGLGMILVIETLTGALIYRTLSNLVEPPLRPDLAARNVSQATYALVLFAPLCAPHLSSRRRVWLLVPMLAGLAFDVRVGRHAPIMAIAIASLGAIAVHRRPRWAPLVLAGLAAGLFLFTPAVVRLAQADGAFAALSLHAPPSWSARMVLWARAARAISAHPLRGAGLEASRTLRPSVGLHPHNAPLQVWLELGLPGVAAVVIIWWSSLAGLRRAEPSAACAASAAAALVSLTFQTVSFGMWQAWFLGMEALAAAAATALLSEETAPIEDSKEIWIAPFPSRGSSGSHESTKFP